MCAVVYSVLTRQCRIQHSSSASLYHHHHHHHYPLFALIAPLPPFHPSTSPHTLQPSMANPHANLPRPISLLPPVMRVETFSPIQYRLCSRRTRSQNPLRLRSDLVLLALGLYLGYCLLYRRRGGAWWGCASRGIPPLPLRQCQQPCPRGGGEGGRGKGEVDFAVV